MRQNDPKMHQNDSRIVQNGILQKSKGGVGGIGEAIRSAAPWPCARRVRRAKSPPSLQDLPGPKDLFLTPTPNCRRPSLFLTKFWRSLLAFFIFSTSLFRPHFRPRFCISFGPLLRPQIDQHASKMRTKIVPRKLHVQQLSFWLFLVNI